MFSDLGICKEVLGSDNKTQSEQRLSNISFWNIFTTETFEFYVILPLKYSFHYYGYILPKSLSQRLTRMLGHCCLAKNASWNQGNTFAVLHSKSYASNKMTADNPDTASYFESKFYLRYNSTCLK